MNSSGVLVALMLAAVAGYASAAPAPAPAPYSLRRRLPEEWGLPETTGCEDIPGWEDADGVTCVVYASEGWCEDLSHYNYAVNGVSAHEACGTSCPELCGELFPSIIVLYPIASIEPISNIMCSANISKLRQRRRWRV